MQYILQSKDFNGMEISGIFFTARARSTREGNIYTWKCLFTFRGGTPSQVWVGGVPHLSSRGRGYPIPGSGRGGTPAGGYPSWGGNPVGGYPSWGATSARGVLHPRFPPPRIASTCYGYAAGGMPLAFTQEDFLV